MTPTYLIRFTQAVVLAAVVAALAAPVALGIPKLQHKPIANRDTSSAPASDVFERYAAAHPFGQGVVGSTQVPDVFERYAAAHPFGQGVVGAQLQVIDGRSPDTRDAAGTVQLQIDGRSPDTVDAAGTAQLQVVDGRSPDTLDAAQAVQPIELVSFRGFDWSDAGIGAAMGAALILLMGTSMLLLLRGHRRHHVQAT